MAFAAEPAFLFQHHLIDRSLPVTPEFVGDYGLTALVDLDRDGDLDFVLGGRGVKPPRLYWYEYESAARWTRHNVGTDYLSDVGVAAFDVDQDGRADLVGSGVWYRNPGPGGLRDGFERIVFDDEAGGAHDVLIADIDGNARPDVVLMGDERTKLNSLSWFSIAADPRQRWPRHLVGPPVHGAITPNAALDVDGDGDLDLLRADTWFENRDGRGLQWTPHANVPMGRKGPYGVCVRTVVADLDGDGTAEVVMADADIEDCRVAVLRNADGKGGAWHRTDLPRSFTYGSLHALAVADFNGDGRPDIAAAEQEELLPSGRENPRWVIWANQGNRGFVEHIVLDARLGGHEFQAGDVDGDGDVDLVSKPWGPRPWNATGGTMHVDYLENLLKQPAASSGSPASHPGAPGANLEWPARWEYGPPLIAPEPRTARPSHAQKDPSIVFHDGRWHVFMTVKLPASSAIEYCSFARWEEAQTAPRTILDVSDRDYFCAPQVFFFRPHGKWYLVYQVGVPGQDKMWVAYSTTSDLADPRSWTRAAPMLDGGKDDPRPVGGLDYWIICDAQRAYLFYTSLDGRMWRLWTRIEDFPRGFDHGELALQADIFEASHTYFLEGTGKYLTIIEEDGLRYYKAYVADRLDGEWIPVADSAERPFAGWRNIRPAAGVEPWTDNVSHGELLRSRSDETMPVNPANLRFLFQGMRETDKAGKAYGQFPWRIGLLTPAGTP